MVEMKFGIVTHPAQGNKYNGDMYLIKEFDHKIMISLIDGLGHGEFAAIASCRCVESIKEHYGSGLAEIIKYCDEKLRKSNGAVMGIILIDLDLSSIIFAGVGNISARMIGIRSVHMVSRDGIVGYRLPRIKEYKYPYTPGNTILMYSDGISSKVAKYPTSSLLNKDVQEAANEIMELYRKEEDDATVIVAR